MDVLKFSMEKEKGTFGAFFRSCGIALRSSSSQWF